MSTLPASLQRDNDEAFAALIDQLRAPSGSVIPFVGAGMSQAFGYPGWGEFLHDSADGAPEILEDIEARRYEQAAQKIKDRGEDRFQIRIHHVFGREPERAQLTTGPLTLLASLANGPVITTNFDRVLERVFEAAGHPFEDVIAGVQLDSIVRAIQTGQHALLKIHGDARERSSRTFTLLEYEERYEPAKEDEGHEPDARRRIRRITVPDLAWVLFTNRPLLFVGSALDGDRIMDVLREIHTRLLGVRHYAIVAAPEGEEAITQRREVLDACGVSPIWFPEARFLCIDTHLRRLQQEATSRQVVPPSGEWRANPRSSDQAAALFADADDGAASRVLPAVVDRVARSLLAGRLAFVVASEEPLITLIGKLGKARFDIPENFGSSSLPTMLAQYGRAAILDGVKDAAAASIEQRRMTGSFVAAIPAFMRSSGRADKAAQLVLTTDYGTMLEDAFERAGEPFDLLYYVNSGEDEGRFLHRSTDGSIRVAERPGHLPRSSDDASLIVKLRGGALYVNDFADHTYPESLAIEESDTARLAGRLLLALPESLRADLKNRRLLVLGWNLIKQPDIDTVIRHVGTGPDPESWSFGSRDDPWYWRQYGLQIRDEDEGNLLPALGIRLRDLTTRDRRMPEEPPIRDAAAIEPETSS